MLDTHVWLWLVSKSDELSPDARAAIDSAVSIALSAFSVWEVALLVERGRIRLSLPTAAWIHRALHLDPRFEQVAVDSAIAMRAAGLTGRGLPGDPADQLILATAEQKDIPLISKDRRLRDFAGQRVIW